RRLRFDYDARLRRERRACADLKEVKAGRHIADRERTRAACGPLLHAVLSLGGSDPEFRESALGGLLGIDLDDDRPGRPVLGGTDHRGPHPPAEYDLLLFSVANCDLFDSIIQLRGEI